jgi:hypothetical protein
MAGGRQPTLRDAWAIWTTFLVCAVLGPAYFLWKVNPDAPAPPPPDSGVYAVIIGFSLVVGGATLLIRYIGISRPLRTRTLDLTTPSGFQRYFLLCVLNWVCSMMVAMTGAIMYWANHEAHWVWLLAAVSVGLLLHHKPQGQGLRQD